MTKMSYSSKYRDKTTRNMINDIDTRYIRYIYFIKTKTTIFVLTKTILSDAHRSSDLRAGRLWKFDSPV